MNSQLRSEKQRQQQIALRKRYENRVAELIYKAKNEYTEFNHSPIEIAAGDEIITDLSVNSYGSFLCYALTGSFTTISDGVDDGVCNLLINIEDTTLSKNLTNGFIPLNLLLTPGRVKSLAGSGDPSNSLYLPLKLNYYFAKNSDIKMTVKSIANVDTNYVNICFFGTRYADRS